MMNVRLPTVIRALAVRTCRRLIRITANVIIRWLMTIQRLDISPNDLTRMALEGEVIGLAKLRI